MGGGGAGGRSRPEHAGDAAPRSDDRAEEVCGEIGVSAAAEAEESRAHGLELREEEVVRGHAGEEGGLPLQRRHGEIRDAGLGAMNHGMVVKHGGAASVR